MLKNYKFKRYFNLNITKKLLLLIIIYHYSHYILVNVYIVPY